MLRLLQMPGGRLSHSTTLRGCKVPRSRKREHGLAPLSPCGPSLILGVEPLLDAFFDSPGLRRVFRRGTNGSNPVPSSSESGANYRVGTAITGRPAQIRTRPTKASG